MKKPNFSIDDEYHYEYDEVVDSQALGEVIGFHDENTWEVYDSFIMLRIFKKKKQAKKQTKMSK